MGLQRFYKRPLNLAVLSGKGSGITAFSASKTAIFCSDTFAKSYQVIFDMQ